MDNGYTEEETEDDVLLEGDKNDLDDDNDELFEGLDDEDDEMFFSGDSDLAEDNVDNDNDII